VVCRDSSLAQRIRELAVHGMPRRYLHTDLGYNSRLDAMQAAVLNVKLPHLPVWVERRRRIAERYREALGDLPTLQLADAGPDGHSWNQFVVRVPGCPADSARCAGRCTPSSDSASFGLPEACCRDWLKQQLQEEGVITIIYYPIPIHRQPAYADLGYGPGSLPVTERLCVEVLSLPIFPELGDEQQERVITTLRASFGCEVHTGLAGTGVVGVLRAGAGLAGASQDGTGMPGSPARSIGLRADMDALPITEANTFAHGSRHPGRMHACGHDGHTTMLLGAAQYLAETRRFDGTVVLIFQPAEENEGGGRVMVQEGLFERFPVQAVYGLHNWPGLAEGRFAVRPGPMMAGCDQFEIELSGRGCHAAMAEEGIDPIVAGSALVQALQTITSRNIAAADAAVVSVTQFHGGEAWNVIPARVHPWSPAEPVRGRGGGPWRPGRAADTARLSPHRQQRRRGGHRRRRHGGRRWGRAGRHPPAPHHGRRRLRLHAAGPPGGLRLDRQWPGHGGLPAAQSPLRLQ